MYRREGVEMQARRPANILKLKMIRENIMRKTIFYIFLFWSLRGFCQDTIITYPLDTVHVTDYQIHSKLFLSWKIPNPTVISSKSVGESLGQMSINLKQYGVNNIAISSLQGGSSYQTLFCWDEISIQNPNTGLFDASIIPPFLFNQININTSYSSSYFGSGAIAGTIDIGSDPSRMGTDLFMRLETVGNISLGAKTRFKTKDFSNYSGFMYTSEQNKYPFLSSDGVVKSIPNALALKATFLQENEFYISKKLTLNSKFWWNYADRNMPQNLLQNLNSSSTNQKDQLINTSFSALYHQNKNTYLIKCARFQSQNTYQDSSKYILGDHHSTTYYSELRWKTNIGSRIHWLIDAQYQQIQANSTSFSNLFVLKKLSPFSILDFEFCNTTLKLSYRKELNQNTWSPDLYSISIHHRYRSYLFYSGISKNYRFPTINDLAWIPGGNPNLKPEHSFKQELGIQYIKKSLSWQLKGFNSNIENWIIWLPSGFFWSPQNILHVWNRGIEGTLSFSRTQKSWSYDFCIFSNLTFSTNKTRLYQNDASYEKQIIFTPFVNASSNLQVSYKTWGVGIIYSYYGQRYYTSDHSLALPEYQLMDLSISKTWGKNKTITSRIQVHNLWNTNYVIMPFNPMPLRYYSLQIIIPLKPFYYEKN